MGRARRAVSTFAGLPLELKQALRAGTTTSQVQTLAPAGAGKQRGDNDELGSDPDPELYAATQRPAKRRRIESPASEAPEPRVAAISSVPHEPNALVPFFSAEHQVPPHLAKYWHQRERLFSRYDEGCLLDEEGWFSVTPERVANQIAERCACNVILDPFCGVGGNAIAFAQTCEQVIAIDNSPTRLALARHNAQIYGVADRIEFILGDFVQFAQSYKSRRTPPIDVVFLSPPWGGMSYLSASASKRTPLAAAASDESEMQHPDYPLSLLQPLPGTELFALARAITPHVALFLPRNSDMQDISALVAGEPDGTNLVEVEEEWMGNKLKALTCYFGGLAAGQEHLFS